jgi:serine/threonine protein kinase
MVDYIYRNADEINLYEPEYEGSYLSSRAYTPKEVRDQILRTVLGCDLDQGEERLDSYKNPKFLGKGTYGKVYQVTKGSQKYARKYIEFDGMDHLLNTLVEIEALKKLSHTGKCSRFIACLEDYFCIKKSGKINVVMVLELIEGHDLDKMFSAAKYEELFNNNLSSLVAFFIKLADGLKYIHSKGYAHFDIKGDNVKYYLDKNGTPIPKYIDFGLSCTERLLWGWTGAVI